MYKLCPFSFLSSFSFFLKLSYFLSLLATFGSQLAPDSVLFPSPRNVCCFPCSARWSLHSSVSISRRCWQEAPRALLRPHLSGRMRRAARRRKRRRRRTHWEKKGEARRARQSGASCHQISTHLNAATRRRYQTWRRRLYKPPPHTHPHHHHPRPPFLARPRA